MENIDPGSLIIAMDNDKQGSGSGCSNSEPFNLRAYGLAVRLLHSNIALKWAIADAKAKDGTDITADVTRLTGSSCENGGVTTGFAGGPLIIEASNATAALAIINTFNTEITGSGNDVRVYEVNTAFVAPIRYTLTHKPLIAVGPDGGGFGAGIHQNLFNRAKLRDAADVAYYDNVNNENIKPDSCYTIATQAHAADTAIDYIDDYRAFATAGGNLLLQCYSVDVFENDITNGRFLSTAGWTIFGTNPSSGDVSTTLAYPNPAIPYAQFVGALGNQDGRVTEYQLNGGAYRPSTQIAARNSGSDSSKIVAAVARIGTATAGGNVFELGGHDYNRTTGGGTLNTALGRANGERMILNAVLTPAYRQGCGLTINSVQGFKTVTVASEVAPVNGLPNYGDTVEWKIRYINDGNTTVNNFQVTDSINGLNSPAKLVWVAGSLAADKTAAAPSNTVTSVTTNPSFNGASPNTAMLGTGVSLAPGEMITITFRTVVNGFGVILNQASGTGTVPSGSIPPVLTDTADNTTTGTVATRPIGCASGCLPQNQFQTGGNSDPTGFDLGAIPTAGDASVGGKVVETSGRGIARETVTLQNAATGDVKVATTNTFGAFTFSEVDTGEFYILTVKSRKYMFQPSQMSFQLVDSLTDLVFTVAEPPVTRGVMTKGTSSTSKSLTKGSR